MAKVTVVGAGVMGSALAVALLKSGHKVTVWNRTPSNAEHLKSFGAALSSDFVHAVEGAEMVVICLTNYAVATEMLAIPSHQAALRATTVVQLSTGSSKESRDLERTLAEAGIPYLDGAILAYPMDIGEPHCLILYGGDEVRFSQLKFIFESFGGQAIWCGPDVGLPSALDTCLLTFLTSGLLGYLQSAALATAEGMSFEKYHDAAAAALSVLRAWLPDLTDRISERRFDGDQFPINGYAAIAQANRDHARLLGVGTPLMDSFCSIFENAQQVGFGTDGLAAVFATAFKK